MNRILRVWSWGSQGIKGFPGRRNSLGKSQSASFCIQTGLKEHVEEKVLGRKTALHMYQRESLGIKRLCFPRQSRPGPSFLKLYTVSAENTPSIHFNKLVIHSYRGNWLLAFENITNRQRTQQFTQKEIWLVNRHKETQSTWLGIKETQMKTEVHISAY